MNEIAFNPNVQLHNSLRGQGEIPHSTGVSTIMVSGENRSVGFRYIELHNPTNWSESTKLDLSEINVLRLAVGHDLFQIMKGSDHES